MTYLTYLFITYKSKSLKEKSMKWVLKDACEEILDILFLFDFDFFNNFDI